MHEYAIAAGGFLVGFAIGYAFRVFVESLPHTGRKGR